MKEVFQLKPLRIESQPAVHSQFFFRLCSNCSLNRRINRTQFRLRSQNKSCFVYFSEEKVPRKSKCSKNFSGFFCSKTLLLRLISQRKSFVLSLYEMFVIKLLAALRVGHCQHNVNQVSYFLKSSKLGKHGNLTLNFLHNFALPVSVKAKQ